MRVVLTALMLLGSLLVSSAAEAQGRPSGVRVTVTNVDSNTNTVDFDVTLNTNSVYGNPTVTSPTGLLGDYIFTTFYATTYPPGYTGRVLSPVIHAVDHGDTGATDNLIPRDRIPQVGAGVYRGSFSHTYPGPGTYTIEAEAAAQMGNVSTVSITTGTALTNPNQTPTTPTGSVSFLGSWIGRSFFGGATTYAFVGPLGVPFQWGVRNSTVAEITPPAEVIPTVSEFGLMALAVALASAACLLLYRR